MDANTWNSYHIISNRARSICYATRQQQFRLKTEFTVNQLASQAENQMELMNGLQVSFNYSSFSLDKLCVNLCDEKSV